MMSDMMSGISLVASCMMIVTLMINAVYGNVMFDDVFTVVGALLGLTVMIMRGYL